MNKQKAKPQQPVLTYDPAALKVPQAPGETGQQACAHQMLLPSVRAAMTVFTYSQKLGAVDINTLVTDLRDQCDKANRGDLSRAEAQLAAQAHTLDAIFNSLAQRSMTNASAGFLQASDTYLRLALKAQSQCRTTWETLAEIKNPRPVAFVKQANISHGPQQVNNGVKAPRAGNAENPPIELSEATHEEGQRLDFGTSAATGTAYPAMATVDAINRT